MAKTKIPLEEGETILHHWGLQYLPTEGGRFMGKFLLTNLRLLYEIQQDLGATAKGLLAGLGSMEAFNALGQKGYFLLATKKGQPQYLAVPRGEVREVEETRKLGFLHRINVYLKDDTILTFDRGILTVKSILQALEEWTQAPVSPAD